MSVRPPEESTTGPDIHSLISIFRRRFTLFVAVATAIFAVALFLTLTRIPSYTATAKILIEPRKNELVNLGEVLSGLPADSTAVDTQVEVLHSRSLAESVVSKLNLERDPEFNPALWRKGPVQKLKERIFGLMRGGRQGRGAASADGRVEQSAQAAIANNLLGGLKIARAGLTYVIDVSYSSSDPEKAAMIANAFVRQYLNMQLSTKLDATRQANLLLNSRLDGLRQQVQQAEADIQSYKAEHNLLSAGNGTLTDQEVLKLEDQLSSAREEVAMLEAHLENAKAQARRGGTGEDLAQTLGSPVVQNLRVQIADANKQIADLRSAYGDNFPDVQRALQQRRALEGQLHSEIARILANMSSQVDVARSNRDALAGRVAKARETLAANNQSEARLAALEQNAEAARSLYASFLARSKETGSTEGLEQSDARIVSTATVPTAPSTPKVTLNLALGLTIALGAALGAVMVAEMLDASLSTGEDIERLLEMPYLPSIPTLTSTLRKFEVLREAPIDYVVQHPFSGFAEAFRALRASVMSSTARETPRVIAVTSSLPGEGKTTASICLARIMGLGGALVLVVDCDLRRKGISRLLPERPRAGLMEVLEGKLSHDDVIVRDTASGACFLPLAPAADTPKDVFSTDAMRRLLNQLREEFDVIILDTPPVLAMADTVVLAPYADVVMLLAQWRKTPRKAVQAANRALNAVNAFVAGVSLTRVDQRKQKDHGYGDPGYYYRSCERYYRS